MHFEFWLAHNTPTPENENLADLGTLSFDF